MDKVNEYLEARKAEMRFIEVDNTEKDAPSGFLKTVEEDDKCIPDECSTSEEPSALEKEKHEAEEDTRLELSLDRLQKSLYDVFDFLFIEYLNARDKERQLKKDEIKERNAEFGSLKTIEEDDKCPHDEWYKPGYHLIEEQEQHEAEEDTRLELSLDRLQKSLYDVFDFLMKGYLEAKKVQTQLIKYGYTERNSPSGFLKTVEEDDKCIPDECSTSEEPCSLEKEQHEAQEDTRLERSLDRLQKSLYDVSDVLETCRRDIEDCRKILRKKHRSRLFKKPYSRP